MAHLTFPFEKWQRRDIAQATGAGIARGRMAAGLTQEDVSAALGIGVEAVSRLERGLVDPPVSRLVELAELFGCPVHELLIAGSFREADQANAIARQLVGLTAKERHGVVAMVGQLTDLLRAKAGRRSDNG